MKDLVKTKLIIVRLKVMVIFLGTSLVLIFSSAAQAQRGMGDSEGVIRQLLKPSLIHISGKLQEIQTHPCENTTGKAELGTHLILKDEQGRDLNIHLGPAPVLSEIVKRLKIGGKIELFCFRTDKMPSDQYVAKTLIFDENIIQLRDSDLRPHWAGRRFNQQTLLPCTKSTLEQKTVVRNDCYYYSSPKSWKRHCFRNGQRPRWRRRRRGRFFPRRW